MSARIDLERVRRALAATVSSELSRRRRAAVALLLAPSDDDSDRLTLLLMRRSERPGDPWSGHMALPGGHADDADADLLQTARRETREEVGIDLHDAELLGRLDDVTPLRSSELAVSPFVFWLGARREASVSSEVAEVLWVPLDALASDALKGSCEVELAGGRLRVPAYVIGGRMVWGMTYRLLERFLAQVLGRP